MDEKTSKATDIEWVTLLFGTVPKNWHICYGDPATIRTVNPFLYCMVNKEQWGIPF